MGYDIMNGEAVRVAEDDDYGATPMELKEAQIEALANTLECTLLILETARPLFPIDQWARLDRVIRQSKDILAAVA